MNKNHRSGWMELLRFGRKTIVLALALVVSLTCMVGDTVAWLQAESVSIVNTFTYGDISIKLEETDNGNDGDDDPTTNSYPMQPGASITKDPVITVVNNSRDSWLFVKLDKSANFDDFLSYEVADGWTALATVPGVFYREYTRSAQDEKFAVLKDDRVSVLDTVTDEQLRVLDETTFPQLTITAYAVQRDAGIEQIDTAEEAWALIGSADNAADTVNP